MGKPRLKLTGQKFGKLLAISSIIPKRGQTKFVCDCECGNQTTVRGTDLKSGNTTSCGCVKKNVGYTSNLKHGGAKGNHTGAYRSWKSMKQRCTDPNSRGWKEYGAVGVTVCDRWLESFENFLSDMGERPDGYSLERIDVFKGYAPENCKWIPLKEQAKNQRRTVRYAVNGKIMIQADAARLLNLHPSSLLQMRRKSRLPPNVQALTG
jgi:hypothetical protein